MRLWFLIVLLLMGAVSAEEKSEFLPKVRECYANCTSYGPCREACNAFAVHYDQCVSFCQGWLSRDLCEGTCIDPERVMIDLDLGKAFAQARVVLENRNGSL